MHRISQKLLQNLKNFDYNYNMVLFYQLFLVKGASCQKCENMSSIIENV